MGDFKEKLNLCLADRNALDAAMYSGDYSQALENAKKLEACALGMGDEELAAKAQELGALAAGKIAAKSTGENSHQHAAASGAFLARFSETLLNVYGDRANLPVEVKQALAKLSAARGSSAFSAEAAKIINELRLSPETYPAFEIGTALLANLGGEFSTAAKLLEATAASGVIGDKTASFAYDFIFGNPENTLLPLYAAGKLGKLVEGLTALGAEALGVTRAATTALKTTTGLATEAPVFVGTGKVVAYEKGKPVELDVGTFFKESFSSGLVFGGLKAAGFIAQTFNLFLPSTEAGRALSFWNANFASVGALMAVSGAERLAAGEHAEPKSNLDAFVEALVVHLGLTKMMGSVSGVATLGYYEVLLGRASRILQSLYEKMQRKQVAYGELQGQNFYIDEVGGLNGGNVVTINAPLNDGLKRSLEAMFRDPSSNVLLETVCKTSVAELVSLLNSPQASAISKVASILVRYLKSIAGSEYAVGRGRIQAEDLAGDELVAQNARRVADFIAGVEGNAAIREVVEGYAALKSVYSDVKLGFEKLVFARNHVSRKHYHPDSRYQAPITYTVEQLKTALQDSRSIQDFVRTLEISSIGEIDFSGKMVTPSAMAQVVKHMLQGKGVPSSFEFGWFGDVLSGAFLRLVNIQSVFPELEKCMGSNGRSAKAVLHDYSLTYSSYVRDYFKLFLTVLPENLTFAEATELFVALGRKISGLDVSSYEYPLELVDAVKESGLNFGDFASMVYKIMGGEYLPYELNSHFAEIHNSFGIIAGLEAHLNRHAAPTIEDIEGCGDASHVTGELRRGRSGNWVDEALRLQWLVKSARSLEELAAYILESPLDMLVVQKASANDIHALVTDSLAATILEIRNGQDVALPGHNLLGISSKINEIASDIVPAFVKSVLYSRQNPRDVAGNIYDLFFADHTQLKDFVLRAMKNDRTEKQSFEELWDLVRQVALGRRLLVELPRSNLLRNIVEMLMSRFIEVVKEVHTINSAKPRHNENFPDWPSVASIEIGRAMLGVEDYMAFALWYFKGMRGVDISSFVFPSIERNAIEIAKKYASDGQLIQTFLTAKRLILRKILSAEGLANNEFWDRLNRMELDTILLLYFDNSYIKRVPLNVAVLLLARVASLDYHRELLVAIDPESPNDARVILGGRTKAREFSDRHYIILHNHPSLDINDLHHTIRMDEAVSCESDPYQLVPSVYNTNSENPTQHYGDVYNLKASSEVYMNKYASYLEQSNLFYHHGYFWSIIFSHMGMAIVRYKGNGDGKGVVKVFWGTGVGKDLTANEVEQINNYYKTIARHEADKIDVQLSNERIDYNIFMEYLADPLGSGGEKLTK